MHLWSFFWRTEIITSFDVKELLYFNWNDANLQQKIRWCKFYNKNTLVANKFFVRLPPLVAKSQKKKFATSLKGFYMQFVCIFHFIKADIASVKLTFRKYVCRTHFQIIRLHSQLLFATEWTESVQPEWNHYWSHVFIHCLNVHIGKDQICAPFKSLNQNRRIYWQWFA